MTHVVSGMLRKATFVKDGCGQDGSSRMYAVELSEQVKDYQTGEKYYSNYKAMIFAKSDAQKNYYDKALAEGSFVVIACDKLKVESREHNGKTYISLIMDGAKLEGAMFGDDKHQQQAQEQQRAPQQGGNQYDYDQEIPFAKLGHSFPRHAIQSI